MQKLKVLWYKLKAKLISSFVNLFASQTNYDAKNTILLIGSARSGTTFLMESLNAKNDFRLIFEPFNPTYTEEWKPFSARHYISPDRATAKERHIVDKILQGRIQNKWVDQYNRKLRSEKRLIKSVRANLMLDFIEKEYPDLPILYLHRNPYEIVASRMNLNFDPNDVYLILEHKEFLTRYYSDIDVGRLKSLFSHPECCHAALWCFENRFILNSLDTRKIIVAKYEDIIGKTITLNNNALMVSDQVRRPSVTTSIHSPFKLSDKAIVNIKKVLINFGMEQHF